MTLYIFYFQSLKTEFIVIKKLEGLLVFIVLTTFHQNNYVNTYKTIIQKKYINTIYTHISIYLSFTNVNILLCSNNVLKSCHGLAWYCIFSAQFALTGRQWLYGVSIFAVICERRPVIRRKHPGFPLGSAAFGVGAAAPGSSPYDIGILYRAVIDARVDVVIHSRTEAGVTASRVTLWSCCVLPEIR